MGRNVSKPLLGHGSSVFVKNAQSPLGFSVPLRCKRAPEIQGSRIIFAEVSHPGVFDGSGPNLLNGHQGRAQQDQIRQTNRNDHWLTTRIRAMLLQHSRREFECETMQF